MNLLKFSEDYPNEQSCRDHFKTMREKGLISCKKCSNTKQYWLKGISQWQCSKCNFRITLRSGAIMESSKLPFRKWYLAMAFMSFSKKGLSACELQRQLDHSRYESIWAMMHKIREAMGNRDAIYSLTGEVGFDEAYFSKSSKLSSKLKRGKGSQKQQNVVVMAESTPLEDLETGRKSRHSRYFKMSVMNSHSAVN
jgi:hypothetical protein